ncbi:MAG: hypothetical protein NTW51_01505 [Cyanobacteria bacterium]|nr:hypothetical protein [Cyanobacteriota bacterium]
MTGLYDNQGVLRCAGRDADDCLAYAELFGLAADRYSLEALEAPRPLQSKRALRCSQADQSLALGQG